MTLVLPWSVPFDENEARAMARDLCEYACNGSRGRPELGDPVYDSVTEGRDQGSPYSSCADLAFWMLYRLGVRLPFINRQEHKGWKPGVNVSRLAYCPYARTPTAETRFGSGDILVVWARKDTRDAHVCVVIQDLRVEFGEEALETANYGSPGGALRISRVTYVESNDGSSDAEPEDTSETLCVRDEGAPVHERYKGRSDIKENLSDGVSVQVTPKRKNWRHVAYVSDGSPEVGWIIDSYLESCQHSTEKSESTVSSGTTRKRDSTLAIATFNIQNFGKTKLGRDNVVRQLVDVVHQYPLVAVQELSLDFAHPGERGSDSGVRPARA